MKDNKRLDYSEPVAIIIVADDVISTSDITYDSNETPGYDMFNHGEVM